MNECESVILKEIIAHCDSIEERIEKYSIDENSFIDNGEFQDMLLMPIFQIGELANSLPKDFRDKQRNIPWREIIGLRNIIAHDYGIVDPAWAWNTITIDIPNLKEMIGNL